MSVLLGRSCPFCDGRIRVAVEGNRVVSIDHTRPVCPEYTNRSPEEVVAECSRVASREPT